MIFKRLFDKNHPNKSMINQHRVDDTNGILSMSLKVI